MEKINPGLFDYLWNLHRAEQLAFDLGYYENYLDGGYCTDEYLNETRSDINKLVGVKWPQEVLDSYQEGIEQGCWES